MESKSVVISNEETDPQDAWPSVGDDGRWHVIEWHLSQAEFFG
jgi:hypothetical protein